jgi:tetratricopeptide (TPR) repeat protein
MRWSIYLGRAIVVVTAAIGTGAAQTSEEMIAQGDYKHAVIQLESICRVAAREGRTDLNLAVALNNLGSAYYEIGRYRDAQRAYERSVLLRTQIGQDATIDAARTLSNLGTIYLKLGLTTNAENTLRRAASLLEAGDPSKRFVSGAWLNLASVYQSERRWQEAEDLLRQTVQARERALGANHRDVAMALNNLAELLHERSRHEEAEHLLERAVAIWEQAAGPNHPVLCVGLHNLAVVQMKLGNLSDAEQSFERVIRIAAASLPADHPDLAIYRAGYAELLRKLDRKKEARQMDELARSARKRNASENALGFTVDAKQALR